jgi:general secretion pathway protein C
MTARALAFLTWAAVAASAMFWGLRLFVSAPPAPANAMAVSTQSVAANDFSRLLGRAPTVATAAVQPDAASRFRLVGVVAPKSLAEGTSEGLALISIDGKPPRHYRVGTSVEGETTLLGVSARGAELGPSGGPATITLNLPAPPSAATGVLPGIGQGVGVNASSPVVQVPESGTRPPPVPAPPQQEAMPR